METILSTIISYLVSLAANFRTDEILSQREEKLNKQLKNENALHKALASTRPLHEEIHAVCVKLARDYDRLGVTDKEKPLWRLLVDEAFQSDLCDWIMTGGIEEGNSVKIRMLQRMEEALSLAKANPDQIDFIKNGYFDALEKAVFAHPILANWRHQLSLNYLREQVLVLRQYAEKAAGVYSPETQKFTLDSYCEKELLAWDIIDLSNLPEGDIHIATQKLLLRQLYMPLRITIETTRDNDEDDVVLTRLEQRRDARRRREAGYFFAEEPDQPSVRETRTPIGESLGTGRRLVVLGDPGGGKTTMLRWMATAYLLLHKGDETFQNIPDTDTLPSYPWIPVLIRCRDLGDSDLCRCFADFLTQHLNKTELRPEEADIMRVVILDRIAKGEVLLLVDGLDEITSPQVRTMFCQELERTSARYPDTPIVVTSRIVGYRDMPYRMGSGFEHSIIAELNREDKDLFAKRWVEITEQHHPPEEKAKRAQELLAALHSSDRIERLTGNPMLLTTLALVKRKVGKLPNRRTKLYAEAVSVLLNWNPRLYQTIDEDEALPQLEYLAYEMCRRGIQRLTDNEVLDLLDKLRKEYPNIRAIRHREPQDFLALLEARSSILIKSGGLWEKNKKREESLWEFRHLTFQEYLAGRALLDGRYPDRDKTKSLAQQVAPLASSVENAERSYGDDDAEVPESWREALRLLVAECKDDDVDEVMLAILNPMPGEDKEKQSRPRAMLAALCLADEPNVSENIAVQVLSAFAAKIKENDGLGLDQSTSLDRTALEVGGSMWAPLFKRTLIEEFCQRSPELRTNVGGLWGLVEGYYLGKSDIAPQALIHELVQRLKSDNQVEIISAALAVMELRYQGVIDLEKGMDILVDSLLNLLATGVNPQINEAVTWALGWLCRTAPRSVETSNFIWVPKSDDVNRVVQVLEATDFTEEFTRRWLVNILGSSKDPGAVSSLIRQLVNSGPDVQYNIVEVLGQLLKDKQVPPLLLEKLNDPVANVRKSVVQILGLLGDKHAVPQLLEKLNDPDINVCITVIEVLGKLGDKQTIPQLLAKLDAPDAAVRSVAIRALGLLEAKQAVPLLLEKLNDPDGEVREAAIKALGLLGDKQAVPPLLIKLDDPDADIRKAAIGTLGLLAAKQAVPLLLEKLNDRDGKVREAAIRALGLLEAKQAVPSLLEKLHDSVITVREASMGALVKLGDKQVVPLLIIKLNDPEVYVRKAAIEILGKLADKQAVPVLIAKLNDPEVFVRIAAIRSLAKLGDKQAIAPLTLLINNPIPSIALAAAAALKVFGDVRGAIAFKEKLTQDSPTGRMDAVEELIEVCGVSQEKMLLSRDLDAMGPWIDPNVLITKKRIKIAAEKLEITPEEVRSLYESLAADFNLKFE